jgi:hypothetical protein
MACRRWRVRIPLAPPGTYAKRERPGVEPGVRRFKPSRPCQFHGALAHLGERYVRNVEVAGSSPACSTSVVTRCEGQQEGEARGIGGHDSFKSFTHEILQIPPG